MIFRALRAPMLALICVVAMGAAALADEWAVGDKVQVYVSGDWFDATITGPVGSAPYDGYYSIHFDSGRDGYADPRNIRGLQGAAAAPAAEPGSGPQPGTYTCVGFDRAQFRWYLTLAADGTYRQTTPDLPLGRYQFYPDGSVVAFDGPYGDNGWFGRFSVEAGGRQQIVLRAVASEQQGPRVDEYANIYCSASN